MKMEISTVIDQAQNKRLCLDTDASAACQTVASAKFDLSVTRREEMHYKGHCFLSLLAN